MLATDMTASGSPEEKLRWAFKMYDKVERFLVKFGHFGKDEELLDNWT